ncbi:MAG TPA: Hsp70 family protein [Verrucomicrobiae bacterium]
MAKFSVGIDLGTTHSAVSTFDLARESGRGVEQQMLPIPQLVKPGAVEEPFLLPSFLYLPNENEFPAESLNLPWKRAHADLIGEFARAHGAKVPTRLVSSAKSWLCHPGVDRTTDILPWQAPPDVQRVSPLEASTRYLEHLRSAWEHKNGAKLKEQTVVLTVPASFDASARDLTTEAAARAGLENVILLEEPQAALYSWIEAKGETFRKDLTVGDVILVIDVGGGTTDFSLMAVTEHNGEVQLTRLAVGDHILLGGDNMDLALAHTLNQQLSAAGKKLDAWQFASLTYACREGKERLFGDTRAKKHPISIASRGSALIGGTVKTELDREQLESILVDGFFPRVKPSDAPQAARRSGLAQMSLPYAQDAAVTRHLAAFLTRQAAALANSQDVPVRLEGRSFVHPTAILFNGGAFKAAPLKQRVTEVVNSWLDSEGGKPVKELGGADLDLSVARGAAYYGWVRQGHGIRIRGGTAHAYYVGVEASVPAVPGFKPPLRALCVAPFGMEEGTKAEIPPQEFGLVVGEPTRFRFFSSSVRREDKAGDMLEDAARSEDLEEVSPVETTLPGKEGQLVPVNLQALVTELGTLELQCVEKNGSGRWKLELNVRMKE